MSHQLESDQIRRAVRQHLSTLRLLGVDSLPMQPTDEAETAQDDELQDVGERAGSACEDAAVSHSPSSMFDVSASDQPPRSRQEKADALVALRAEHDAECPHCTVATGHTQTVFGEGDPDAGLMFVGEAPGAEEDRLGRPFVGRSGKKLDDMIKALGLEREQVYIANVLKARPPGNATPTVAEAARCGPFLERQIEIIQPKVIVTLGGPAAKLLLETREGVTKIRGRWHSYRGVPVMPTFHPAYLLRQYTVENRQKVWSDLQKAAAKLSSDFGQND